MLIQFRNTILGKNAVAKMIMQNTKGSGVVNYELG